MSEEFDRFERRILEELQKDCTLSTAELAFRIGLSQSPCWRRLQRLKDEGYIKRQVAIVDRSRVGPNLIVYALLRMATLTDKKREDFIRKVEVTPEILECHTVFGEMDVMLKVVARSLEWYQQFVFDTIMKLPGVRDVQSTATLVEIKSTTEIPLFDTAGD